MAAPIPPAVAPPAAPPAPEAPAVVGGDVLWKRLQDKDPFRYRREILVSTLQMIRQRPWIGFGLGTYATVYPEFASFDIGATVGHAHNDWAEWTAEGGVPMLLLTLAIATIRFRPALRSGWGLGIHAIFLHSLADFPLQIPAITALLFTLLAAVAHQFQAAQFGISWLITSSRLALILLLWSMMSPTVNGVSSP